MVLWHDAVPDVLQPELIRRNRSWLLTDESNGEASVEPAKAAPTINDQPTILVIRWDAWWRGEPAHPWHTRTHYKYRAGSSQCYPRMVVIEEHPTRARERMFEVAWTEASPCGPS